jgi:putative peptidoglycan lipid II flippase
MQLPETLIATAIATAAFPTLSEFGARGQIDQLHRTFNSTLRAILALTIPAAIGLLIFGRLAVQILFERGKFTAESTTLVTWVVQAYALGLIGHSTLEVAARAFYAQKDTLTPLFVAAGAMIVNIGLSFMLSARIGVGGLALANSIGVTVEVIALLIILRRRLKARAAAPGLVPISDLKPQPEIQITD